MKTLYYMIRCYMYKPVCYRDGLFAKCRYCGYQSESHRRDVMPIFRK